MKKRYPKFKGVTHIICSHKALAKNIHLRILKHFNLSPNISVGASAYCPDNYVCIIGKKVTHIKLRGVWPK